MKEEGHDKFTPIDNKTNIHVFILFLVCMYCMYVIEGLFDYVSYSLRLINAQWLTVNMI